MSALVQISSVSVQRVVEANLPSRHAFTMIALEPVWVPIENLPQAPTDALAKPERKGRARSAGPNGEHPDSGRWRLRLPDGNIYDGPTVSASALDTASDCLVKWALDRLDENEKPENRKAELGGLRHAELEAWIKYGTRVQTEGMTQVIEHFPMPGQMECEVYFGFLFGRPGYEIVFAGYLDGRESMVDEPEYFEEEDGTLTMQLRRMNSVVRDLKTTGDFRWKKTPAQLRANIQASMYALGEMLRVEDRLGVACDTVILKWTYALLKENKEGIGVIKKVETTCDCDDCRRHGESSADPEHVKQRGGVLISKEEAVRTMAQYLPLAEMLIDAIASGKKAKDLEKNAEACGMYNGCGWKKIGLCEPPAGGGFKSLLRQERARLGIELSPSQVLKALSAPAAVTGALTVPVGVSASAVDSTVSKTMKVGNKKMSTAGLGSRFGIKNGAAAGATPAAVASAPAKTQPVRAVAAAAAATVSKTTSKTAPKAADAVETATPKAASGFGARFAKKAPADAEVTAPATTAPATTAPATTAPATTAPATTIPPETKLSAKATEDGMAAKAEPQAAAAASAATALTLKNRLQGLSKGKAAAAVDAAPAHAVGASVTGALAVGINPPDAAPEWTQEQQEAEAERIAKKYGSVESGSAELLAAVEPSEAAADGVDGAVAEGTVPAKRGRGRPAGSKAKPVVSGVSGVEAVGMDVDAVDPQYAQTVLDSLAMRLMSGGYRKEAASVLELSAKFAA